ncbi:hypothetical protein MMC26_005550 [Xylographa opegraphella]|nr:hypothetical protein [Xylographa opegraphella]
MDLSTTMQKGATSQSFASPKRKRDPATDHTASLSPCPIRLRTDISLQPADNYTSGNESPRTTVAGQMQALRLGHEQAPPLPSIPMPEELSSSVNTSFIVYQPQAPSCLNASFEFVAPQAEIANSVNSSFGSTTSSTQVLFNHGTATPPNMPSTPHLKPISPLPARTISPLPRGRQKSPPPPARTSSPSAHLADATRLSTASLPARPISSPSPSPPSTIELENLGLNGIGYRPTPAIAYARAQRRKQQVAEWKVREAKEARQRRSELRKKRDQNISDSGRMVTGLTGDREGGLEEMKVRRVRFVEG